MMKIQSLFCLGIFLVMSSFYSGVDVETILKKSEEKMKGETMYAEMQVNIVRPRWNKQISLKSWLKGKDKALALVTAPDKEAGTIFLKNGKQVWNYLPKVKKFIRLPSSMMGQNWMGTDLTNDDLIKQSSILDDYSAKLLGVETKAGLVCYKIELQPKNDAAVVWGKVITWVDKTNFIQWCTTFYDEDEELVNTLQGSEVKTLGNRRLASKYVMTPADKDQYSTTIVSKKLIFNAPISNEFFTPEKAKQLKP